MNLYPTKSLAAILVLTVASLPLMQMRAEAMLAPARTVQSAPQFDRAQDAKEIQATLENKLVREKLHALGLSDAEIQSRLTRLSDAEVHQLSSQIRSIHPAGDIIIGVLVIVVLVLLVIFLIKRV